MKRILSIGIIVMIIAVGVCGCIGGEDEQEKITKLPLITTMPPTTTAAPTTTQPPTEAPPISDITIDETTIGDLYYIIDDTDHIKEYYPVDLEIDIFSMLGTQVGRGSDGEDIEFWRVQGMAHDVDGKEYNISVAAAMDYRPVLYTDNTVHVEGYCMGSFIGPGALGNSIYTLMVVAESVTECL